MLAALFKCLDPALTIAATLNSKSPFVVPFGREQEADTVKQSFKKGRPHPRLDAKMLISGLFAGNSDFLTIANVFAVWRRMSDNPNAARVFCRRNFLSQQVRYDEQLSSKEGLTSAFQTLQQIEELRQQLYSYLVDTSFVKVSPGEKEAMARYAEHH